MFIMISWVLSGAVFGSVGVAFIASAFDSGGPRGDDFQTPLLIVLTTTILGAVSGGVLARMVRRKFADNPRRLDQLALAPLLPVAALVGYAMFKP